MLLLLLFSSKLYTQWRGLNSRLWEQGSCALLTEPARCPKPVILNVSQTEMYLMIVHRYFIKNGALRLFLFSKIIHNVTVISGHTISCSKNDSVLHLCKLPASGNRVGFENEGGTA